MNRLRFLVFFLFFLCFTLGFGQTEVYKFPKIETGLSIPVSIPVKEINSLLNRTVTGVIYLDDSFTDNDNDQFKVKVTKAGDISLTALKENRFLVHVFLDVVAQKGYGAFGQYVYQQTEFGVSMKFITSVNFQTNWTLDTKTEAYGFEWTDKPVLVFGSARIPITPLVESTLREQQNEFATIIDRKISESMDLKPYLLKVWNQFVDPIQISEEYNTWLKLTPISLNMTPLKIYSDYVKTQIGLNLFSETFVGQIPKKSALTTNLPNFSPIDKLDRDFSLKTTVNIPYEQATEIAKKQFIGFEFVMTSKKNPVKVEDIRVFPKDQNIAIEIKTSGELTGTTVVSGVPFYDEILHKIRLKDSELEVDTKNVLQRAVLLIFKGKIKKTIEEEYGIPLKDIEDESKKGLLESFNKEYYPGIFLKGNVTELKPTEILIFDKYMTVVIDTRASLRLDVKELNF